MRVLLVTMYYPPEIGGAAHSMYELGLNLKSRGHAVTVLTGYPTYNVSKVPPKYRRGLWLRESVEGVDVYRVRIPSLSRASKIARGLQHFVSGLTLGLMMALARSADVAMVMSPPLPLAWLVSLVGRLRGIPVLVNVQDLFPREAVDLGLLTNPFLIKLFEMMERGVYRLAAAVTVHSPGNRKHILERGGDPKRVHVAYNWVDTDHVQPGPRDNGFAREHRLDGRFIVSYAGTMGWAQDMGTIIEAAARLRTDPEILFLLVGDGVEKEKAQARARELGLDNIVWLPMQPWSVYPEVLAASDVSLINLNPELRTPVVPSKLLSIMAAGRPVVASVPAESDARVITSEAGCGICVGAGDGEALAEAIRELAMDRARAQEMGQRGRSYVTENFGREACTERVEAMLKSVAEGGDTWKATWEATRGKSY